MPEIVVPAFSPEAVTAAVQNGAAAVYIDFGGFADEEAFSDAVRYCRVRGVRIYFSLDRALTDLELPAAVEAAGRALRLGVHAVEVGDFGLLSALRRLYPSARLHLGPRAGIHNAAGAATAAYIGADRIVLSPRLTLSEICSIRSSVKVELELPCHGPVCTAAPGSCRMSAFSGRGEACFGRCSGVCRRAFGLDAGRGDFYLSSRDICLVRELPELISAGIQAFRVLGGARRAEYSALTAEVYSATAAGRKPEVRSLELLEKAFAPNGMVCGFFDRSAPAQYFGRQDDSPRHPQALLSGVSGKYLSGEAALVPVRLLAYAKRGEPFRLAIADDGGASAVITLPPPEPAAGRGELTSAGLRTQLHNLRIEPFFCREAACSVDSELYVSAEALGEAASRAAQALCEKRAAFSPPVCQTLQDSVRPLEPEQPPEINISVQSMDQLSPELAGLKPNILYVPLTGLLEQSKAITPFWENGVTTICAVLPPLIHDGENAGIFKKLDRLHDIHINDVLISDLGQIVPVAARGFTVRADIGLGAYNSRTLRLLKELKLASAAVPPELSLADIRALAKFIPVEAVLYGRVAVMHSEACIIKAAAGVCSCERAARLRDRRAAYPVLRQYGCRSTVYSSEKLFLAGKRRHYENIGLWCARLDFTTENPDECVLITQRFLGQNRFEPSARTTGLYI